ncbi:MAG: N-acetylmuramic acid 6-phosphate etherase [Planctomycetota bacterium]|nr:N-acetylmuramic acid 6-phosphate etherase [Planctomycetota bacterium]
MNQVRTTEQRNPASMEIDRLSAIEIARLMNEEDQHVLHAVSEVLEPIAQAVEAVADAFRRDGRLIYIGAGTSGRLGVLDASECPPTFNSDPSQVVGLIAGGTRALTRAVEGAEDSREQGAADLSGINLQPHDVLVGIATSGRTPYVLGAVDYAKSLGCTTVGVSCNAGCELESRVEIPITAVVGPEIVSGSTRLKSGTVTKLILNTLTTGAMILVGKTYGNLMVDLRASNTKLVDRTQRIVSELTGLSSEESIELLKTCDGELKTAVVVHLRDCKPNQARGLLDASGGHLRAALEQKGG